MRTCPAYMSVVDCTWPGSAVMCLHGRWGIVSYPCGGVFVSGEPRLWRQGTNLISPPPCCIFLCSWDQVSTAETGSGGGNPAGGHGPGVAGSSKYLGPSPDILEDLIAVYHQLGLDMAAAGILRQAEQRAKSGLFKLDIRPSWLEKLSRWGRCVAPHLSVK